MRTMFAKAVLMVLVEAAWVAECQVVGSQMVEATIPMVHEPPSPGHFQRDEHRHDGHDHGQGSGGKALMCNCTFPTSRHCSFDGLCDASHVALHLRNDARTTRRAIEELRRDARHRKSGQWRRSLCGKLSSGRVEDLLLLEYEEWEPACQRLSPSELRCGMAPKAAGRHSRVGDDGYALLTRDETNARLQELFNLLRCNGTLDTVPGHVYVCQSGDYCNAVEPLVRSAGALSDAAMPLWFYVVVPVGALLFLTIIILIVCAAYRGLLWKEVMKVSETSHRTHHKYYEDVDIAEIMPESLPAKDIQPDSPATV